MKLDTTKLADPPFVRPLMMPDELGGLAHVGRLRTINGFQSIAVTRQKLVEWAGHHSKSPRAGPILDPLAATVGLDVPEYLQRHSMHFLGSAIWQPDSERPTLKRALTLLRPAVYLCRQCLKEDLQRFGMPYWHREHQLPGNYWCRLHSTALWFTEDTSSLCRSPSQALACCSNPQFPRLVQMGAPKLIERFLQIERGFLTMQRPLSTVEVSRVLQIGASREGLRDWRGARHTMFSDLIAAKFSSPWLRSVLPLFEEKQMGSRLDPLDSGLAGGTASVTAFVVALAVLYESASAEIDALLSDVRDVSLRSLPKRAEFRPDDLRRAYISERGLYRGVSRRLELAWTTTQHQLLRMGLPSLDTRLLRRIGSEDELLKQICIGTERFVRKGCSLNEACEGLDLDVAFFERLLRGTATNLLQATSLISKAAKNERKSTRSRAGSKHVTP